MVEAPLLDWTDGPNAPSVAVKCCENPERVDGDDANIPVLHVRARGADGAREAKVPCLRTREPPIMCDWFRAVSTGIPRMRPRWFMCLDFDLEFHRRGVRGTSQRMIAVMRFALARVQGKRAHLAFDVPLEELAPTADRLDGAVSVRARRPSGCSAHRTRPWRVPA